VSPRKILFLGPLGAGKTTAISMLSDAAPVSTEAASSESTNPDKHTTTVAMDYGEVLLDDGGVVMLYGIPGQDRFDFMWDVLAQGALGAIILLDAREEAILDRLAPYLAVVRALAEQGHVSIGLGWCESAGPLETLRSGLLAQGLCLPVFAVDARRRDDVLLLLEALVSTAELH